MIVDTSAWGPPPDAIRAVADEVHVWLVVVPAWASAVPRLERVLSADEQASAARLATAELRTRYIVAHGALRAVLARYLAMPPERIVFGRNAYGKPLVAGRHPLCFNLSHAGDLAVIGVSWARRLGIDIERVRTDLDLDRLAAFAFSAPELAAWRRVPPAERTRAFFAAWTCKEAYVKAEGLGLSLSLKAFAVALGAEADPALVWAEGDAGAPRRWTIRTLPVGPGYAGAVAVEGQAIRARHWQWQAL